jgi:hypothetical protein
VASIGHEHQILINRDEHGDDLEVSLSRPRTTGEEAG